MEDGDDPNDPHGDGFGDDLMGDDDDREKLESLTEFQREARGGAKNKHSTDVESPPPPPTPRVCMSIHPERKSCGHVRSRFECLL